MRHLKSEDDLAGMLAEENAALFVFVDWSEYARRGKEVFKEAEAKVASTSPNRPMSWWIADITSIDSPPNPALHRWLKTQEQKGKVRVFPNIALGNGSVVWLKSGEIVRFEPSAQRSGQGALVDRAEEIFAES